MVDIDLDRVTPGVRIVPDLDSVEACNRAIHAEMEKGAGLSPDQMQIHFRELQDLYLARARCRVEEADAIEARKDVTDSARLLASIHREAAESDRTIAEAWRSQARLAARGRRRKP